MCSSIRKRQNRENLSIIQGIWTTINQSQILHLLESKSKELSPCNPVACDNLDYLNYPFSYAHLGKWSMLKSAEYNPASFGSGLLSLAISSRWYWRSIWQTSLEQFSSKYFAIPMNNLYSCKSSQVLFLRLFQYKERKPLSFEKLGHPPPTDGLGNGY